MGENYLRDFHVTEDEIKSFPLRANEIFHEGDFLIVNECRKYLPRGHILDIGCGSGKKTFLLKKVGFDVVGMDDFSDDFDTLPYAKAVINYLSSQNITVINHNCFKPFPFDDEFFDNVVMFNVLEHFHHSPKLVMHEIGRVLKKKGKLLIQVPNAVNLVKRMKVFFGKSNYPPLLDFLRWDVWRGHVREYTLQELKVLLKFYGFKIINVYSIPYYSFKLKFFMLKTLHKLLCKIKPAFGESLIALGEKA